VLKFCVTILAFILLCKQSFLLEMKNLSVQKLFLCDLVQCINQNFIFQLTVHIRIITHLLIGLLLGAVYYNAGNDASKVLSNSSCIFFFTMFLFFANSMPCAIASKCNRNNTKASFHYKEPVLQNEGKLIKKSVYTTSNIVM